MVTLMWFKIHDILLLQQLVKKRKVLSIQILFSY